MKLLRDFLDSQEEHFTEGGKFEKLYPQIKPTKMLSIVVVIIKELKMFNKEYFIISRP